MGARWEVGGWVTKRVSSWVWDGVPGVLLGPVGASFFMYVICRPPPVMKLLGSRSACNRGTGQDKEAVGGMQPPADDESLRFAGDGDGLRAPFICHGVNVEVEGGQPARWCLPQKFHIVSRLQCCMMIAACSVLCALA